MRVFRAPPTDTAAVTQVAQALGGEPDQATKAARSRFFAVVLQYDCQWKKEKMERELRARGGMSKKGCQLHFADQAEAEALTGFVRNAVTPLGMKPSAEIPLFLSHHIPALKEGYFWLGGGAINLKLGVRTDDFVSCLQPVVADVTFKEGCETGVG